MHFVQLLLPDFTLILSGWLVCRYTALNRPLWQQVEALVYYFLFPVLLFHSIVRSPLDLSAASSLIGAGMTLGLAGIAMAYCLPWLPLIGRHIDRRDHAASAQVAFRFNSFIALALAERVGGPAGVAGAAVLIGVCVPMFNVAAVWPMARQSGAHFGGALLRNPLILATASGLAANVLGFTIPTWIEPAVSRIGASRHDAQGQGGGAGMQFGSLAQGKALAVSVLGIRHLALPLLALALSRLFRLDPGQATVLLMFSALPTSSSGYVLAAKMGYNGAYVAALVTLSTMLAAASLPFALSLIGG